MAVMTHFLLRYYFTFKAAHVAFSNVVFLAGAAVANAALVLGQGQIKVNRGGGHAQPHREPVVVILTHCGLLAHMVGAVGDFSTVPILGLSTGAID